MPVFRRSAIYAILCIIIFLTFYPCLFNQFTNWDDDKFLTANPVVQQVSWNNFVKVWFSRFEDGYQPLTMFSFFLEHALFKLNPFVYHLDNLLLHMANTVLVFAIIRLISQQTAIAFVTAVLFAVSPMKVEPVAWVSARKDVLFAFFYLFAIWAYLKKRLVLCFVLFFFSCMAKHQAATFPLVLLILDKNFSWRNVLGKSHFFITAAIFLGITVTSAKANWTYTDYFSIFDKGILLFYGYITYLYKAFVPYPMGVIHAHPFKLGGYFPWYVYGSIAAVLGLWALAYAFRHKAQWFIGGIMFFSAAICLNLATIMYGGIFVYDRYTYLPYIGIYFIVANLVFIRKNLYPVVIAGMLIFAWLAHERCKVWYNGVTIWSDAIARYPKYHFAYNNRGTAYALNGQDDLALLDFEKAVELNPNDLSSLNNRVYIYRKLGQEQKLNQAINDLMNAQNRMLRKE